MISSLQVRFLYFEPVSSTFAGAVDLVRRSERARRAESDNRTLADAQVLSWRIGAQSVELLLSTSRVLRIFLFGDVVDWVFDEKLLLPEEPRLYSAAVRLEFEDGHASGFDWHPDAILANRTRTPRLFLAPSTTLVSLGVGGRDDILFAQMADHLGQRMLFFEEE